MDQGQVQVVGLELAQALFETWNQQAIGEVGDPDLAGDKQLITWDAAIGDGLANVGLVLVDLRGVDDPVAQFQAGADGIHHHLALQTESAETKGWDVLRGGRHQ